MNAGLSLRALSACVFVSLVCDPALSQDIGPVDASQTSPLGQVLVIGHKSGPKIWRVTQAREDGDHTLWLLATPPVLFDTEWDATRVDEITAHVQEVVHDANLGVVPGGKVSVFKIMFLAPSVLGARKSPNDATLEDTLSAEWFDRWTRVKKEFIGRDASIERWRPMFAADKLKDEFSKELQKLYKDQLGGVSPRVNRISKEHGARQTYPSLMQFIPVDKLRASVKEFKRTDIDDVDCLTATIEYVEAIGEGRHFNALKAKGWVVEES